MTHMHAKSALLAAFFLVLIANSSSAEPLSGAILDVPPYGMKDTSGALRGAYVELMTTIVTRAGFQPELRLMPYSRAIKTVSSGDIDLGIMFINNELKSTAVPVAELTQFDVILLGRAANELPLSLNTLSNLSIGRLRGGCEELAGRTDIHFVDSNSHEGGLKMLNQHRIDAFCSVKSALISAAADARLDWASFGRPLVIGSRAVWLHASKNVPSTTIDSLRNAVSSLKSDGTLQRIITYYFPEEPHRQPKIAD